MQVSLDTLYVHTVGMYAFYLLKKINVQINAAAD